MKFSLTLSISIFLISLSYFFFEFYNSDNYYIDSSKENFSLQEFLEDDSVNKIDTTNFDISYPKTILYAIPYKECSVCINEIINIFRYSETEHSNINHIVFVYGDDLSKIKHALLTSDIVSIDNILKLYGSSSFIDEFLHINNINRSRIAMLINSTFAVDL